MISLPRHRAFAGQSIADRVGPPSKTVRYPSGSGSAGNRLSKAKKESENGLRSAPQLSRRAVGYGFTYAASKQYLPSLHTGGIRPRRLMLGSSNAQSAFPESDNPDIRLARRG